MVKQHSTQQGFTLVELLVVVVLLGVISAIGVPIYTGYADTAKVSIAQNNVRTIALAQEEYLSRNNLYLSTGATCLDAKDAINTTLFNGRQILEDDGFNYCITQATTMDYTVRAEEVSGSRVYTINQNRVTNF